MAARLLHHVVDGADPVGATLRKAEAIEACQKSATADRSICRARGQITIKALVISARHLSRHSCVCVR
jgi:hypothetical protein